MKMVWQDWYNSDHLIKDKNVSHYHLVNLTDSYMTTCYLKVDMRSTLNDSTEYCYSTEESIIAGVAATFQGIAGTFLNFLFIVAVLKHANLRKEYLTPSIISLATTDLLFSAFTLPMLAIRYFSQYV